MASFNNFFWRIAILLFIFHKWQNFLIDNFFLKFHSKIILFVIIAYFFQTIIQALYLFNINIFVKSFNLVLYLFYYIVNI